MFLEGGEDVRRLGDVRRLIGWRGTEQLFYGIPNILAEGLREIRGMRVQPWRGIGAGYNKFADVGAVAVASLTFLK